MVYVEVDDGPVRLPGVYHSWHPTVCVAISPSIGLSQHAAGRRSDARLLLTLAPHAPDNRRLRTPVPYAPD
jgi:hypothetical protein